MADITNRIEQESFLLIQNSDLSKYSLLSVMGMDAAAIVEALSVMDAADRRDIAAYLENRGAEVTEAANERTREVREYRLDVRYNTDTNQIIDLALYREQRLTAEREKQLFDGGSDKYGIYQLKDDPGLRQFQFAGTESLKRRGIIKDSLNAVRPENYNLVYVGELSELQGRSQGETLETIYVKFNKDHPEDFRGHSLSVSDVVVLHEQGKNSAHYVDSIGYTELSAFLHDRDCPAKVAERKGEKAGEKVSLKSRLAEKKALTSNQGKDHGTQKNAQNEQKEI